MALRYRATSLHRFGRRSNIIETRVEALGVLFKYSIQDGKARKKGVESRKIYLEVEPNKNPPQNSYLKDETK